MILSAMRIGLAFGFNRDHTLSLDKANIWVADGPHFVPGFPHGR